MFELQQKTPAGVWQRLVQGKNRQQCMNRLEAVHDLENRRRLWPCRIVTIVAGDHIVAIHNLPPPHDVILEERRLRREAQPITTLTSVPGTPARKLQRTMYRRVK